MDKDAIKNFILAVSEDRGSDVTTMFDDILKDKTSELVAGVAETIGQNFFNGFDTGE